MLLKQPTTNPQTPPTETGQTGYIHGPTRPQFLTLARPPYRLAHPVTGSPPAVKKTASPQVSERDRPAGKGDRSRWEIGDNYPGVLFAIPGTAWRVAVCAKGYCWILQQREGKDRWHSRKFFARKARLALVLKELVGTKAFKAIEAKIEALPI